jgi:cytochrome c oxidase subunit 3
MADFVTLTKPFSAPRQQRDADFMGMYVFLATETMLFGGLLVLIYAYRVAHPEASFTAARHLKLWIATANTGLLLTSSLAVALAVLFARHGRRRLVGAALLIALMLGLGFLGLKSWEYLQDFEGGLAPGIGPASPLRSQPAALFINLYFVATGLHAVHLIIGLGALIWTSTAVLRRKVRVPNQVIVVEMTGLYWHFVDVVWVFVFPIFYLARG